MSDIAGTAASESSPGWRPQNLPADKDCFVLLAPGLLSPAPGETLHTPNFERCVASGGGGEDGHSHGPVDWRLRGRTAWVHILAPSFTGCDLGSLRAPFPHSAK